MLLGVSMKMVTWFALQTLRLVPRFGLLSMVKFSREISVTRRSAKLHPKKWTLSCILPQTWVAWV